MIKTHKIALNPNHDQIAWFYQQCGYAKFAYNAALSDFKAELSADNFLSMYDLNKRFNQKKKAFDWTKAQDQRAAMYAVHNLGCAIDNWRKKRAKFPKLKRRGCKHSYTTDEQSVRMNGNRIKLPKIGWVKTFQKLRFVGKILSVTISRTAHRWFASVSLEVQPPIERCPVSPEFIKIFISKLQSLDWRCRNANGLGEQKYLHLSIAYAIILVWLYEIHHREKRWCKSESFNKEVQNA